MMYLETLEGRRFFSVTITQDTPHVLNVAVDGYVRVEEIAPRTFNVFGSADATVPLNEQPYSDIDALLVQGGKGADVVDVNLVSVNVYVNVNGGAGDDSISLTDSSTAARSNSAAVTLSGGNGNDVITVFKGNKTTVYGGNGNDAIVVHAGSASVFGGNGNDAVTFYDGTTVIEFDGGRGTDTFNGALA